MSLLLDALKRAEQEKLTRHAERPAAEAAAGRAAGPAVSAAVLELQPFGGSAAASVPRPETAGVQAAQAVFKAKAAPQAPGNRRILWAAAGVIVVVVAGAAAYLWHTLQALAPRPAAMAAIRRPAAAPPSAPAASAPKAAPVEEVAAPAVAGVAAAQPSPSGAGGAAPAPEDAKVPARPRAGPDLDALLRRAQPAANPPVELARTEEPAARIPAGVESGYQALLAGDLDAARKHYAETLASDPANVDAQLGIATVEARLGNVPAAAAAYRRVLEIDPRNPTAAAGLAALADLTRPEALENALRAEIARHPESAALELTLGNVLAAQGRWAEAQAAYFDAQRLQPENADVAYNLAVSLDHLGQRRAAAAFYRRALEARRSESAQFDAAAASRRLAELSR